MRILFVLSCLGAGLLVLGVLLAPWLNLSEEEPADWLEQLLLLFARDAVVRRISLAGAVGLAATAFVFFRPSRRKPRPPRPSRRTRPPHTMAGA